MAKPIGKRLAAVCEVDPAELAVRLCEAQYGLKRPQGSSAREALDGMDEEVRLAWLRSAKAAADYFVDLINDAKVPS